MPLTETLTFKIEQAAALIHRAQQGGVLTGAGISTPSGIPDFRSPKSGLWQQHNPLEVASLSAFRHHPERFFAWVHPLLENIVTAQPNAAHYAIAALQQTGHFTGVITQNIDGLHQKAGSAGVIEVHGSLATVTCIQCYRTYESLQFLPDFLKKGIIPRCPHCGGILKPDVVLFGEQLPWQAWEAAERLAHHCDLCLVAGSSLAVMPVARLPIEAARRGAALIIINQTPTYLDKRADVVLHGDVAVILPALAQKVQEHG